MEPVVTIFRLLPSALLVGIALVVYPAHAQFELTASTEPQEELIDAPTAEAASTACARPLDNEKALIACVDELMISRIFFRPGSDGYKHDVAGAAVSIVEGDRVLLTRGYGCANADSDPAQRKPADTEGKADLFRVGSVSKLVAATAFMQIAERIAQERGISVAAVLDTDVNEHLQGSKVRIPATFPQPVTLKNLLTHTGGFEENQGGYIVKRRFDELASLEDALAAHMPARVRPPVTHYESGYDASYSSWGIALLGHIVAQKSGKSFDQYVEEEIFDVLSMEGSTFREYADADWPQPWKGRIAKGHQFRKDSTPPAEALAAGGIPCPPHPHGRFEPQGFEYLHSVAPSASLTTTAADMASFMIAHLRNPDDGYAGPRILKSATARMMHQRQLTPKDYGDFNGAGLGFYEINRRGRRILSHSGKNVWFSSKFALLPEQGLGIFVTTNSPVPDLVLRNFMNRFLDCYLDQCPTGGGSPPVHSAPVAQYAGVYFPTTHSYTRNEKFSLFAIERAPAVVAASADGRPRLEIANLTLLQPRTQWDQIEPGVFLLDTPGHRQELIAFEERDGVMRLLSPMAFAPAYKAAWYEAPDFHRALHRLSYAVFATAWLALGFRLGAGNSTEQASARWLAAALAAHNVAALQVLIGHFSNEQAILYGYTPSIYAALALLMLSVPMTTAVVYWAIKAWVRNWWTLPLRLQYTVFAVMALAFLWSMHHWNLIGYKPS